MPLESEVLNTKDKVCAVCTVHPSLRPVQRMAEICSEWCKFVHRPVAITRLLAKLFGHCLALISYKITTSCYLPLTQAGIKMIRARQQLSVPGNNPPSCSNRVT